MVDAQVRFVYAVYFTWLPHKMSHYVDVYNNPYYDNSLLRYILLKCRI